MNVLRVHLYKHVNVGMCERVLGCLYVSVLWFTIISTERLTPYGSCDWLRLALPPRTGSYIRWMYRWMDGWSTHASLNTFLSPLPLCTMVHCSWNYCLNIMLVVSFSRVRVLIISSELRLLFVRSQTFWSGYIMLISVYSGTYNTKDGICKTRRPVKLPFQ